MSKMNKNIPEPTKQNSTDFNIYYLNFSKVYEIAMMINNVILTKIERDNSKSFEKQYGISASLSAQGAKKFLDGIKSSLSADAKETSLSSTKVIESLDVKTTKSILLRKIIERCTVAFELNKSSEGDLIKVDNVELELFDENSLRQFLILKRDAFKGFHVDGMDINNLVSSMLQDYAYVLKGKICNTKVLSKSDIIIKIPMELQSEFENKYSINDLLIGHVSIVGIYKGEIGEDFITSNTFSYFKEAGEQKKRQESDVQKVIKSGSSPASKVSSIKTSDDNYHFIDTIAIIQDVSFKFDEKSNAKIHWWNKFGVFLSKLGRK